VSKEESEALTAIRAAAHRARVGKARPEDEAILAHLGLAAPANDNAQPPAKPAGGDG